MAQLILAAIITSYPHYCYLQWMFSWPPDSHPQLLFPTIETENSKYLPSQPFLQLGHGHVTQSWAIGLEWKFTKGFWERFFLSDKKTERQKETLDIVMERDDT